MRSYCRFGVTGAIALCVLSMLWAPILRAETATAVRATQIKKEPATDAETVASLEENQTVQTAKRRGGWIQITTEAGGAGWVKFLALRFTGSGTAKASNSGVAQLFNVARGGTSGSQVTTGVRGLDAEDISGAQPNAAALQAMDANGVSSEHAGKFAAEGKLQAQSVDYPADE